MGHPDDRALLPVEADRLTDDVGTAAVLVLPEPVREHRHGLGSPLIFSLGEATPQNGWQLPCLGQSSREPQTRDADRLVQTGEYPLALGQSRQRLEAARPLDEVHVVRGRHAALVDLELGIDASDERDRLRLPHGQVREDDHAHQAEDRGVHADRERERHCGYDREGGALPERAKAAAEVLDHGLHRRSEFGSVVVAGLVAVLRRQRQAEQELSGAGWARASAFRERYSATAPACSVLRGGPGGVSEEGAQLVQ